MSDLGRSKSVLVPFLAFLTKIRSKNMHHTTQSQNFKFGPFDFVTLDDLDLTQGHKRLRKVLRSIPDTIHVVPSALIQFGTAALPGEANNDR